MNKILILILIILFILTGCNNEDPNVMTDFTDLFENMDSYIGKNVSLKGTIHDYYPYRKSKNYGPPVYGVRDKYGLHTINVVPKEDIKPKRGQKYYVKGIVVKDEKQCAEGFEFCGYDTFVVEN